MPNKYFIEIVDQMICMLDNTICQYMYDRTIELRAASDWKIEWEDCYVTSFGILEVPYQVAPNIEITFVDKRTSGPVILVNLVKPPKVPGTFMPILKLLKTPDSPGFALMGQFSANSGYIDRRFGETESTKHLKIAPIKVDAGDTTISKWNTSGVVNMDYLFAKNGIDLDLIKNWDVTNVKSFVGTFYECTNLKNQIDSWQVESLETAKGMFEKCINFTGKIDHWNMSNATDLSEMFRGCTNFNSPLRRWDVSNVLDTSRMFYNCLNYAHSLKSWNVGNVRNMASMFYHTDSLNHDLDGWDTKNVTDMSGMFSCCQKFNASVAGWDVRNVTSFRRMFKDCFIFGKASPTIQTWILPSAGRKLDLRNMLYKTSVARDTVLWMYDAQYSSARDDPDDN